MNRGGWGEGSLKDLGSGRWLVRLPPYLGRKQYTFMADSKTAARKEQRRLTGVAMREMFNIDPPIPTFDELCDTTLDQHVADPHSTLRLREQLKSARKAFGDMRIDLVTYDVISAWRKEKAAKVAPATIHGYTAAVKQVFNSAVKRNLLAESPARHVKNPQPAAGKVTPFVNVEEVMAVSAEMPAAYQAIPLFVCASGLRPEEWRALERADVRDGAIFVNKRYVRGMLKPGTKNGEAERRVPLHPLAARALRSHVTRLDTRLLFPAVRGGYIMVDDFRDDVWKPALKASGVEPRRIKDMRHTYASWQLTGNCNIWHLSKAMGTSVYMIERTYGRWMPGSDEMILGSMDAFVARESAAK